jgi:YD repeat-containing protein
MIARLVLPSVVRRSRTGQHLQYRLNPGDGVLLRGREVPHWRESLFDASENGFPQKIVDPNGEGNTVSLSYTSSKLTEVTDTHGHKLVLTRDPTTHHITKIENVGGEHWQYFYNAEDQISRYVDREGHETTYGYTLVGDTNELNQITDAAGTYVITYDAEARATGIRRLENGTVTTPGSEDETMMFKYEAPAEPTCNPATDFGQTTVTQGPGTSPTETYCYNAAGERTGYSGPFEEGEAEDNSEAEQSELEPVGCQNSIGLWNAAVFRSPAVDRCLLWRSGVDAQLLCRRASGSERDIGPKDGALEARSTAIGGRPQEFPSGQARVSCGRIRPCSDASPDRPFESCLPSQDRGGLCIGSSG